MKNNNKAFFLPYQLRWLNDKSKVKIWEKSRRIGATYVQSYEDVRDCVYKRVPAVWFSSADESAAREYIDYCEQWTKLFNVAAKSLGEVIIDNDKDIKAFVIEFNNGTKIHALSSNPKSKKWNTTSDHCVNLYPKIFVQELTRFLQELTKFPKWTLPEIIKLSVQLKQHAKMQIYQLTETKKPE